jgi:hypothetical protein
MVSLVPGPGLETDVWILPDGRVRYIEKRGFDLSGLGPKESLRLSRIERDAGSAPWRVVDQETGRELGSFPCREEAVEFEHAFFRSRLPGG